MVARAVPEVPVVVTLVAADNAEAVAAVQAAALELAASKLNSKGDTEMGKKNTYTRTETRTVKSTPMFGPAKSVTYTKTTR